MNDTSFLDQDNFALPNVLRLAHDELRAQLVMMMIGGGPIMVAAKRLANLCMPHFEWEEKTVFPLLGLLPEVVMGKLPPGMAQFMPLLEDFRSRKAEIDSGHLSILAAIELLRRVAVRTKNADCAAFASTMQMHESVEEKVVLPMVISLAEHLRASAAN